MIYLIHGENYFQSSLELSSLLDEIKKSDKDVQVEIKYADEAQTLNDIFSDQDAFSMFSSKKFLVVKRFFKNRKSSLIADASDYLSERKDSDIIFWEANAADRRSKLYKLINKIGVIREFENRNHASLKSWVQKYSLEKNLKISATIADEIIFKAGGNEAVLANEIDKLSIYLGDQNREEVVNDDLKVVTEGMEASIWEFIDAITERNYKKALISIDSLVRDKSDYIQILGMIARQIRIMAQIINFKSSNIQSLGLHPFVISKIKKHLDYFTKEKIKQMYSRLVNLDLSVKTGKIEEKLGLTLYVMSI